MFKPLGKIVTDQDLNNVNDAIKQIFPQIDDGYLFASIEKYNKQVRGLYNQYVASFCKPDTPLKDYPDNSDIIKQLIWISKYTKRIEIFYI